MAEFWAKTIMASMQGKSGWHSRITKLPNNTLVANAKVSRLSKKSNIPRESNGQSYGTPSVPIMDES